MIMRGSLGAGGLRLRGGGVGEWWLRAVPGEVAPRYLPPNECTGIGRGHLSFGTRRPETGQTVCRGLCTAAVAARGAGWPWDGLSRGRCRSRPCAPLCGLCGRTCGPPRPSALIRVRPLSVPCVRWWWPARRQS